MDFTALTREIGVAETARRVDECGASGTRDEASRYLPLPPSSDLQASIRAIASSIVDAGWRQVLMLNPETMLMDELARQGFSGRVIVCIAREVDDDAKSRIARNVPDGIDVACIDEGEFPARFLPGEGAVLALGYGNARRACIQAHTARMLEYYASFSGACALACLGASGCAERPFHWIERSTTDLFNSIINDQEGIRCSNES